MSVTLIMQKKFLEFIEFPILFERSGFMDLIILLQIFVINLVYIVINTLRLLLTMKGYRRIAPIISVAEVVIYTMGLSLVMKYISQPVYLIAYALGFGVGIYLGIIIEDYLALGYSVIQVFTKRTDVQLPQQLRSVGYGVTEQPGYGRDGERTILTILTPRKNEMTLSRTIDELSDKAFYISYNAKYVNGGFWTKRINRTQIEESETLIRDHELEKSVEEELALHSEKFTTKKPTFFE